MQSATPQFEPLRQSFSLPRTTATRRQALLLAAMATLLLVMPVSYRAGAETSHPHAVLQGWIDAAHGDAHHHHPDEAEAGHAGDGHHAEDSVSVRRWATAHPAPTAAGAPAAEWLADTPTLSPLKAPLSSATPLLALASAILMLEASASWRPLWAGTARMLGQFPMPELPPPRPALRACQP